MAAITLSPLESRRTATPIVDMSARKDVAREVGLSETQLSLFRSGKVRGIGFSTLARLCLVLDCQPGELLAYSPDPDDLTEA